MLYEIKALNTFWGEVVQTIVYILNRAQLGVKIDKNPSKQWKGKASSAKYIKVFLSKCFIKEMKIIWERMIMEREGIFLVYSSRRKGYHCYNKRLNKIVEIIDVMAHEDAKRMKLTM